jgi:hypothetical protein
VSECVHHRATLWLWSGEGQGSWHFLTIEGDAGEAISAHEAMRRLELGSGRGFGSVKVEAQIGGTSWNTSVFPSKTLGWILPVKASVRKAEGIVAGDETELTLTLL